MYSKCIMEEQKRIMNEFIYFWNPKDVKYGYLSNFFLSDFVDNQGVKYCCNEQYFMKKKQETFEPHNVLLGKKIMDSNDPAQIKKYGRQIKNFSDEIWDKNKFIIMCDGLYYKFKNNETLRNELIETHPYILCEASRWDNIWGIGMDKKTALNTPVDNYGLNLLGKALMKVRKRLIEEYM